MILWIILALMTGVAVLVVLVPLTKLDGNEEEHESSDVAVYKDQLNEVASDLERGLIAAPEAQAARTEIARRLLKAADSEAQSDGTGLGQTYLMRKITSGVALACIPAFALGVYLITGTPDLPGQPFAERKVPQQQLASKPVAEEETTTALIGRAEEHLKRNPNDVRGYQILAPIYTRLRRFSDATHALKRVMELSGNSPKTAADYGEALVVANRGDVSPQALAFFQKLSLANPKMPRPLHYIALADAQAGRLKQAAEKWRTLLAANPQDTPWKADIERLARRAEGKKPSIISSLPNPEPLAPAPLPQGSRPPALSNEQMQAGSEMDAKSRQVMIGTMVKQLSDRLATNGGSVGEWVRLARSYQVLGKNDEAKAAITRAEAAYVGKPEDLAKLKDAREQLGFGSEKPAAIKIPPVSTLPQGSRPPALSKEQMQAGSQMDAKSRQAMIGTMVKRLSDRLAADGGSVGEWVRLARAYMVLGKSEPAKAAIASAQKAYAGQSDALEQLGKARQQLGIE